MPAKWEITRREFLKFTAGGIALMGMPFANAAPTGKTSGLRFGIATDIHYADTAPRRNRYYRQSLAKLAECVSLMNDEKVDFLVELGDFKDEGKPPQEPRTLQYLRTIENIFAQFNGKRFHVLGNHDMDSISKDQFLSIVNNTGIAKASSYYAFDEKGVHFVVLDANYRKDGADYDRGNFHWTDTHIPAKELNWLNKDLAATSNPAIIFIHQPLYGPEPFTVKNAAQVREILQASRKVLAVFQGHYHAGGHELNAGIHYYTLKAVVDGSGIENSAYAIVDVQNDSIIVTGYRRAENSTLEKTDQHSPEE